MLDVQSVYYTMNARFSELPRHVQDMWDFYSPQHTRRPLDIFPERDAKEWNRDLYSRHSANGRRNVKETRRREHLRRVAASAKKNAKIYQDQPTEELHRKRPQKVEDGKVIIKPHGLCDDYPEDKELITSYNKSVSQACARRGDSRKSPYKGKLHKAFRKNFDKFSHVRTNRDFVRPEVHDPYSRDSQLKQMQEELDLAEKKISEQEVDQPSQNVSEEKDCEDDTSYIEERNEMVRGIDEVEPIDTTRDKYADILKSVGSARDFLPQGMSLDDAGQIDEWISHLENLTILSYQMYRSETFMDMFFAIVAFAKSYTKNRSITMELYKIIDEVTSSTKDIKPNALSDWTGRKIMDNWEHFKTNTVWKKVSYLISAAMSLTACTTKNIEWSPFGLKLVAVEAAKEQLKAVDVLDALIKTFVWFCETGCECIAQRSLAPLLYSDTKLAAYDKNCDYVLAYADSAIAGNVEDLGEFEKRLEEVIARTAVMKSARTSGASALWLQNRYVDLVGIKEKLVAKRRNTDIRQKPDGWSISGSTKVGKSILADLTMKQSLSAQGYCKDGIVPNDRILTKDMFDKYDSTWTSDILGVYMDDLGNSKAQTNQTDMNHTATIIKFFNNVAAQAIKAELNSKGVVFIDFRCGVVTSNVMDLDARAYSNCPESILRRFKHVTVKVKEKYRLPGSTMIDEDHPDLIAATSAVVDVWELCIWECHVYETADKKTAWKWRLKTVTLDNGTELICKDLGLEQYLEVVRLLAIKHKRAQETYVERAKYTNQQRMCATCTRFPEYCKCTVRPNAFELGDVLVNAAKKAVWEYCRGLFKPVTMLNELVGFSPVKKLTTAKLATLLERELHHKITPVLCSVIPEWVHRTSLYQSAVTSWQRTAAFYDVRKTLTRCAQYSALGCLGAWSLSKFPHFATSAGLPVIDFKDRRVQLTAGVSLLGSIFVGLCGQYMHSLRVTHYENEFRTRRDALPQFAKEIRDGSLPKGILIAGTLILGLKIITLWNDNRIKQYQTIVPAGISPVDVDEQPSWFGYMLKSVGFNVKTQPAVETATTSQLITTLQKNVFWATFTRDDGSKVGCNIFFPRKSVALFPLHVFYPRCDITGDPCSHMTVEVLRSNKVGGKFTFIVEFSTVASSNELDMCAAYVPNSPDIKSAEMWLPLDNPKGRSMCNMMLRTRSADVVTERVCVEHGQDGHMHMGFYGGRYTTVNARDGVCMAPLIAEGSKTVVVGFHIGGDEKRSVGVMQTLTKQLYDHMVEKLKTFSGVEISAQAVDIPDTQYGKKLISTSEVHHCATYVNNLTSDAYVDILGGTLLRSNAVSKVQKSILSDHVEKHFKISNCWGAPRLKPNWKAFNATLEHIVNPAGCFVPSRLERARQDWLRPIIEFAKEQHKKDSICPLSDRESIMGVPGKRFLDALPMKTGMGYPIFGPKNKWFEDVYDEEGNLFDRVPDECVREEVKRIMDAWRKGERAYPVSTATLKDEPTPLDKEKVRVFQAGAVALSILIRKYFLPIARLLSLNPLLSESAVGVNAFSPQWEEMMAHATKYSSDNKVIAWDYSKYDVRMNSQITRAVWLSFIEIAAVCGYSKEDLHIMRNSIVDITHPLMDYNGTMIMAYNMNTSGNNLTVNVNGTAGSLYVRMGFFDQYPEAQDFRACVSALTYGDDFKGSVHKDYHSFNFLTFKRFLSEHGMKVTLPDKSDNEVAFMENGDADFLKRNSVFIPEIGRHLGALDEMSIFKSLHANLRSKGATQTEVAMSCIDGAMHEWFAHGREVYEDRREKMKLVCEAVELPMPSVQATFDERVDSWREKYL